MSVYFEAVQSGRILLAVCTPIPGPILGGRQTYRNKGIARALREAKRLEAEERNADTPVERRKAYRRQLAVLEAKVTRKGKRQ